MLFWNIPRLREHWYSLHKLDGIKKKNVGCLWTVCILISCNQHEDFLFQTSFLCPLVIIWNLKIVLLSLFCVFPIRILLLGYFSFCLRKNTFGSYYMVSDLLTYGFVSCKENLQGGLLASEPYYKIIPYICWYLEIVKSLVFRKMKKENLYFWKQSPFLLNF